MTPSPTSVADAVRRATAAVDSAPSPASDSEVRIWPLMAVADNAPAPAKVWAVIIFPLIAVADSAPEPASVADPANLAIAAAVNPPSTDWLTILSVETAMVYTQLSSIEPAAKVNALAEVGLVAALNSPCQSILPPTDASHNCHPLKVAEYDAAAKLTAAALLALPELVGVPAAANVTVARDVATSDAETLVGDP